MKRVLRVVAVLWAVGLVGWAVARAQGWIGETAKADVATEPAPPTDTDAPILLPATKSGTWPAAAPATTTPPANAPALLPATKSGLLPPEPEPEPLFPATKSGILPQQRRAPAQEPAAQQQAPQQQAAPAQEQQAPR